MIACTPFVPDRRTGLPDTLPSTFPSAFSSQNAESVPLNRWWESFGNAQLNGLVEEALGANFSLRERWAQLRQAKALTVKSGTQRIPTLDGTAAASVGRQQLGNNPAVTENIENYSLGLSTQYELDLWGRIHSKQEATVLSAIASREDLNAAAITLAANVTIHWIKIISQGMQKSLIKQQLKTNQTLLELLDLRFRKSLASALDVLQQRQVVNQSMAQLPLIEQTEHHLLNGLALLLGRTPFTVPTIQSSDLKVPTDIPFAGVPAQLLVSRPDIRSALRRLESADWDVASAKADRLPAIRLTARATYQANELNLLFHNWLINLVANLTAPLLDGGLRKAEVQRLTAVVEEKVAAYGRIVLTAVIEVENALVSERKLRHHLNGLEAQLDAARKGLNEARSRYRSGLSDYLPVLTQLLTVQNLDRAKIQRVADLLISRVDLYRAIGATWPETLASQLKE